MLLFNCQSQNNVEEKENKITIAKFEFEFGLDWTRLDRADWVDLGYQELQNNSERPVDALAEKSESLSY